MKETPELLKMLIQATVDKRLSWSRVEKNRFHATLPAGTVEISGDPAPASLQVKLTESWLGTGWSWLSAYLSAPLETLRKVFAPEGQSKVSWPARQCTVASTDNLTQSSVEFDREHPSYLDASTLLMQVSAVCDGDRASQLVAAMMAALGPPTAQPPAQPPAASPSEGVVQSRGSP
jgi:hypothetical protein